MRLVGRTYTFPPARRASVVVVRIGEYARQRLGDVLPQAVVPGPEGLLRGGALLPVAPYGTLQQPRRLPAVARMDVAVQVPPGVPRYLVVQPAEFLVALAARHLHGFAEQREVEEEEGPFGARQVGQMIRAAGIQQQAVAGRCWVSPMTAHPVLIRAKTVGFSPRSAAATRSLFQCSISP